MEYSRLSEIYDFQYGKGNNNPDNGGIYPVYGSNGIIGGYDKYNNEDAPVIGHIGANAGSVVWANGKHFVTYNGVMCNIKNNVNKHYGYYALLNANLKSLADGSAQPFVSYSQLNRVLVYLPERDTQDRIADILKTIDDLIDNNASRIRLLEQMSDNLYKEWFVRFRFPGYKDVEFENGIPKGWEIKKIVEIGEVVGGGTPSTKESDYWNGNIPWLTPADLASFNGVYISSGEKSITELGLEKSSAKIMPKNTVLLSSRAPIGYVALARNEMCTNQGFKSVVCDETKIMHQYLFYFFKMNKSLLEGYGSGATFLELSGSSLKRIKLLIPPMEIQKKFSLMVDNCFEQIYKLSLLNSNLTKQRDLLLPRLMSGKLEV
ncbi:type I restriction enzyme, S subunit [Pseudobutyrivibrio sp. OR37]|uniref:restriction endonuclease subunit S n=1 Tax=Pseudobutyrivibrio sp. OR37 TaxID=1798186 RepID=UPI0008E6B162|nr:restriction endonuclease subunit S [Pseudobutyrivibrio sp. OR37]SFI24378.1 type I restriction enzyme, S subunit [Pseudobutyrivibrio sp. OR37]